jgi:hypothetical protein
MFFFIQNLSRLIGPLQNLERKSKRGILNFNVEELTKIDVQKAEKKIQKKNKTIKYLRKREAALQSERLKLELKKVKLLDKGSIIDQRISSSDDTSINYPGRIEAPALKK